MYFFKSTVIFTVFNPSLISILLSVLFTIYHKNESILRLFVKGFIRLLNSFPYNNLKFGLSLYIQSN